MEMLKISHNIYDVTLALKRISNEKMPKVAVRSLNATAYDAFGEVQDEMLRVFDRPTRWTLNALMVWRATLDKPQAEVRERPSVSDRHYLKVQGTGGERPQTGVEGLLKARIPDAAFHAAVTPAQGAKRDSHGNWSPGQRNQMLSGLGAQRDKLSNTTERSRRRNKKRATFFATDGKSTLSPGVYARTGDKIEKIVHFTKTQPKYKKRIDYREVVERKAAEVFPGHFARELRAAFDG